MSGPLSSTGIPKSQCTLATCTIADSFWDYRPSLAPNATLLALFTLSLLLHAVQGFRARTWAFTSALLLGCTVEVMGYIGRLMGHANVFSQPAFLMQIVCLTIAPAMLAAGVYLTLSRIIIVFGTHLARMRPMAYSYIFMFCDFWSLLLQAIGGGRADIEASRGTSTKVGTDIMIAGLGFQVFTLTIFMALAGDFALSVWRAGRKGEGLNPVHQKLRASLRFKGFIGALVVSTVCIFIRSVYRVIELSQGWKGKLISKQEYFVVLEGVMVIIAVLVLNAFHPGWAFSEGYAKNGESSQASRGDAVVESTAETPEFEEAKKLESSTAEV